MIKRAKKKLKLDQPPEKYVSPRRQAAVAPSVATCVECKLPAHPGLPPFVSVTRLVDDELKKVYRHATCPTNPEELLVDIEEIKVARKAGKTWRKTQK
jgi:hypothetical protein